MRRLCLCVATGCIVLSVCTASQALARSETYASVRIDGIPHVRQKPDFCGEACAEMYLRKLGRKLDQDAVFDHAGLDPLLARGCYTRDLSRALSAIGFDIGPVWYRVAADASDGLNEQFRQLHADLKAGVPSIVCMHYDDRPQTTEHFRLIVGYDRAKDEVLYHEPAVEEGAYRRMKRELLLKLWPLKYDANDWTIVRMPLKPARLVEQSAGEHVSDADFAQHIMQLKQRLPGEDFAVHIERPFVVVGDETPEALQRHSKQTIRWAVDHLKKEYFAKDPDHIIDIWLFKDDDSYETNAEKLFGEPPSTPYGYYSARDKALVMNIATGSGTLVHEIVHPFIAANFPECPSWFNEGLASLYEQCGEQDGRITGYTNWRLGGLKEAIRADRVPSFKTLTSTTTREFYNEDPGTNYSQARYLCYYLQDKGLLQKYYRAFVKSAKDDPTGYKTLRAILDRRDMEAFQEEWEAFVLKLER